MLIVSFIMNLNERYVAIMKVLSVFISFKMSTQCQLYALEFKLKATVWTRLFLVNKAGQGDGYYQWGFDYGESGQFGGEDKQP